MKSSDGVSAVVLEEEEKLELLTELRSVLLKAQEERTDVRVQVRYPKLYELKLILDAFHTAA